MISAREAAALGRGAGRVLLAGSASEPVAVLDAVARDPEVWRGVTLTGAFLTGANDRPFGDLAPGGRVETIFATEGLRDRPATAMLPLHDSAIWDRLARPGVVDLVVLAVPPPRGGTVSLGPCADFAPAAIGAGARLIGAVNPRLPDPPDAPSRAIAGHVLGPLRRGDTLQLGLGKLQTAILRALARSGLRDLGSHAGMVSTAMAEALEAGVFGRGVATGVALGDAGFYRRLPDLPLRFAPVGWTHAPATLAAIPALFR